MAAHNELGSWGEDMAAAFLRDKGYVIIRRDWRSGHRDIDIIARDGGTLVFVEVKTRRNRVFMEPEEAVDYHKLRNLSLAMNHYVKAYRIDSPVRLDIVTVVGDPDEMPDIQHLKDIPIL